MRKSSKTRARAAPPQTTSPPAAAAQATVTRIDAAAELTDREPAAATTAQADAPAVNELAAKLAALSRDELGKRLVESLQQINQMQDRYLRSSAEVENIRRRAQNEIVTARKFAIEGFAQELLNVKDSLEQAAKVELDDTVGEAVVQMKQGLNLTLKQFDTALSKFAVSEVAAAPGVKFNPEQHQAISMVASEEVAPQHIVAVVQKGFLLKERLLRPAMVVVCRGEAE